MALEVLNHVVLTRVIVTINKLTLIFYVDTYVSSVNMFEAPTFHFLFRNRQNVRCTCTPFTEYHCCQLPHTLVRST